MSPSPVTPSATTPAQIQSPEPRSGAEAAVYQRLREHLAYLRLPDAATALPGILDDARVQA